LIFFTILIILHFVLRNYI